MNIRTSMRQSLAVMMAAVIGAGLLAAGAAWAQSPPNPPSRFVGTVTVDGAPAAAGTTIEAHIGTATCGTTAVFSSSGQSRYTLDSPALDAATNPGCGTDGATVEFFVAGRKANETASWANYQLNTVNLTVAAAAAATATPRPSVTPGPPTTGTGPASNDGFASPQLAAVLAGMAVLGLGGSILALRARNR